MYEASNRDLEAALICVARRRDPSRKEVSSARRKVLGPTQDDSNLSTKVVDRVSKIFVESTLRLPRKFRVAHIRSILNCVGFRLTDARFAPLKCESIIDSRVGLRAIHRTPW